MTVNIHFYGVTRDKPPAGGAPGVGGESNRCNKGIFIGVINYGLDIQGQVFHQKIIKIITTLLFIIKFLKKILIGIFIAQEGVTGVII